MNNSMVLQFEDLQMLTSNKFDNIVRINFQGVHQGDTAFFFHLLVYFSIPGFGWHTRAIGEKHFIVCRSCSLCSTNFVLHYTSSVRCYFKCRL